MLKILLGVLLICVLSNATPVMTRQYLLNQKHRDQFCMNLLNFNNFYYSKDFERNVSGIPADMSIHWKTENVFFTLVSEEMKMSLQLMRPTGEIETIKVAGLGQSSCVDNLNDIVYIATDNGVYKYKEDGIEMYAAHGEDVMYVATTSDGTGMYIATWPQNRVQKISNFGQKQENYPEVPNGHGLTVDTRNNIYFIATKTPYILKVGQPVPIKIEGLPSDKMIGVFVSRSDDVFGMDENSNMYLIDSESVHASHLGSFNVTGVNTFALDSADNVLIGVKGAIIKFKAYEKNPCATQNFKGKRHNKKRKHRKRTTTTSTTETSEDYSEEN